MNKYTLQVPVERASGHQFFTVLANSEKEAIAKFKSDGGEYIGEEVEVTELGNPEVVLEGVVE